MRAQSPVDIPRFRYYAGDAAEHSAAGFDSPEIGGRPPLRGFFTSVAWPSLGGPCGEPPGSPVLSRSVNLHGSAHPFDSGEAET